MRTIALAATALATAFVAITPTLAQVELPQRRAGQWEITIATGEGAAATEIKATACTDASSERAMMQLGAGQMGEMCQRNVVRRDGQDYVMDSDCQMGPMRVVSTARISGDFQSAYQMRIEGTVTGMPGSSGQRSVTTQSARFVSATCTGGLVPGDIQMPGGPKINVLNLPGSRPGGANRRQP